ncbi:MAG: NAD(P)/FAD-dependent oxidoreductase [Deltaproteobacteria bacterium]|nr:NAD(P)/FAD-dependent oxidoreductase [Deltaproteobacteria bacterium]
MRDKSVVIVGGGIAGLSAGIYARRNGYPTTILEMHDVPGGLCTAWKRKGYTFDISMHMFTGSKRGAFHTMWQELGVLDGLRFVYHSEIGRLESRGKVLAIGTDRRRLEAQMLAHSPADARPIRELLDLLFGRALLDLASLDAAELSGPLASLRMLLSFLPFLPAWFRYGRMTVEEFADRFQDPFLRETVRRLIDTPGWPMPRFPVFALSGLVTGAVEGAGVPIGGSQPVVLGMAERFKKLGGELRLKTRVKDLLVERDRAVGVRLADDSEVRADTVIWAADGHTLIFDLLGGRYIDDAIRSMYDTWTPVVPLVHVALGVARDMSQEPRSVSFELEQPLTIAGQERRWMQVIHHSFDPTMAPPGKAAVEVWWPSRLDYWQELREDRPRYVAEKQKIADATIDVLDKRWPGFKSQLEVVDVPTPATYVRYTGNWKGSPDGWYITPENMKQTPRHTLPGLAGLYTAGQWTAPFAGTPISALSGRQVVQLMCRRDGTRFRTAR